MKKMKTIIGMISVLTASLSEFSSCSKLGNNGKGEIQLVTDGGRINDLSFIQNSWEAVEKFAKDNKINYSYKLPSQLASEHEFINCYKAAISSKAKIIVASGYQQKNALIKYANNTNKNIKFITVDFKVNENGYKKNNVAQICYKSEQSGFWAGIASCAYLNSNATIYMQNNNELKIGSFGGVDFAAVTSYMFGFHCATIWWNKNLSHTSLEITKIIKPSINEVHRVTNITPKNNEAFSGSFKITDGLIITEKLLKLGANIIFPVAGGQTQDAIAKINSSGNKNVKIIGVDTDQSKMYVKDQNLFLTSALKQIEKSIINTLKQWNKNNDDPLLFKEQENYGDNNEFVGIAKSNYVTNELIEKIKTSLSEATEKVSEAWDEICQDNNSFQLWERTMKKNITF